MAGTKLAVPVLAMSLIQAVAMFSDLPTLDASPPQSRPVDKTKKDFGEKSGSRQQQPRTIETGSPADSSKTPATAGKDSLAGERESGVVLPTVPRGLYVCRGPGPTPEKEVNFPFIDGWLVRPGWDMVEPEKGKYDWNYIDDEIALAKKLKKKISLAILGGPQTPAWTYQAGVKQYAYTLRMARVREAKIPIPWDETYLEKWTALVREFGKRYNKDETVTLVHITGSTGNGLEMQLPFRPDETAQWEKAGYTPEKLIASWGKIIDAFAESFPDKPLDIDVHPVLGSDQVAQKVAAYASEKLGARFGIFGGWLSGKGGGQDRNHAGMRTIAAKYGPKGFAAFQMIASETSTPTQFAEGGLKVAVEQAMEWNARYFEIWESDAMNTRLQTTLADLAEKLKAGRMPPTSSATKPGG